MLLFIHLSLWLLQICSTHFHLMWNLNGNARSRRARKLYIEMQNFLQFLHNSQRKQRNNNINKHIRIELKTKIHHVLIKSKLLFTEWSERANDEFFASISRYSLSNLTSQLNQSKQINALVLKRKYLDYRELLFWFSMTSESSLLIVTVRVGLRGSGGFRHPLLVKLLLVSLKLSCGLVSSNMCVAV